MNKNLYKGIFNWKGTSHILYTHAKSRSVAFYNFIQQMADKVEYSFHHVYYQFVKGECQYTIEEDKK